MTQNNNRLTPYSTYSTYTAYFISKYNIQNKTTRYDISDTYKNNNINIISTIIDKEYGKTYDEAKNRMITKINHTVHSKLSNYYDNNDEIDEINGELYNKYRSYYMDQLYIKEHNNYNAY